MSRNAQMNSKDSFGITKQSLWEKRARRKFFIFIALAAFALAGVGWVTNNLVSKEIKKLTQNKLEAILHTDITALREWYRTTGALTQAVANSRAWQKEDLDHITLGTKELAVRLGSLFDAGAVGVVHEHGGFAWSSDNAKRLGPAALEYLDDDLARVSRPVAGGAWGARPAIIAAARIPHIGNHYFVMRFDPHGYFSKILEASQSGASSETYAVNAEGLMVSQSRFIKELQAIQLLEPTLRSSILNISVRDPGEDLTQTGNKVAVSTKGLTKMAASLTAGEGSVDVHGYRDYRGVPVVGAWKWLPDLGFGVASEVDVAEAFRPLYTLRMVFFSLLGILSITSFVILIVAKKNQSTAHSAQRAQAMAEELGQYHLDEKIGEGGMGAVYRGHHKMLRRPTAIKTILDSQADDETIERFSREVQLTCSLSHPNTIAIFDYGRSDSGSFYYAMEYLDGSDLETLVEKHGAMPPARVVHLLIQALGALAEAHDNGLIHRDIKPANIFCCERGGMNDFIKVLDFGLVKRLEGGASLTQADIICGTPHYMSPEVIQQLPNLDGRVDTYAIAIVGYYLLTAKLPYGEPAVMETVMAHLNQEPPALAEVAPEVPEDLADILMKNMNKDPADRDQDARAFADALQELIDHGMIPRWTQADAQACREQELQAKSQAAKRQLVTGKSLVIGGMGS
jgi:hypothetical protein